MGMFNEGSHEPDIIKEMAEGLGSSGIRLEEILDKVTTAKTRICLLMSGAASDNQNARRERIERTNEAIGEFNTLVDKAEDALRWLLIQREACGFRTHKNVHVHYPIPPQMRMLKNEASE